MSQTLNVIRFRVAASQPATTGTFFWGSKADGGRGGRGRGRTDRNSSGGRGPPGPPRPVDPTNTIVYVGNLTEHNVDRDDLSKLFGTVGPLVSTRIGDGAVFGFVEFERHDDAARAIQVSFNLEAMYYTTIMEVLC